MTLDARADLERQAEIYEHAARVIRDALRRLDAPTVAPTSPPRRVQLREADVDAPITAREDW